MSNTRKPEAWRKALSGEDTHRPETTVELCLRGDLQAEFEDLSRLLNEQPGRSDDTDPDARIATKDPRVALAQRMEKLREQMQDAMIVIRFRALKRAEYRRFLSEYPARDKDQIDGVLGYNYDTGGEALMRACLVSPELSDAEWRTLVDEVLTDGQYEQLVVAAGTVNRGRVNVPFSSLASILTQSS